jgi:GWxTD domain-containing protein
MKCIPTGSASGGRHTGWALMFAVAAAMAAGAASGATPYEKWLNEDVVYIIADGERAAFEKLTTDQEREKFIEQFWVRRDPTPGTPENEFKAEHYRRIAGAMQRFGTASGKAGGQTDRGHVYILYGPPDELEAHPKDAQRAYATQVWMYRRVAGLGNDLTITFLDATGGGDFQVAPGNGR